MNYLVCLETSSCGCGVWKDTLIPCSHALAFMTKIGKAIVVPKLFTVQSYHEYYAKGIPSIDFHSLRKGICIMPETKKKRGRPQKKRIPSTGESEGKQLHKCKICKEIGHNKKSCPNGQE